MTLTFQRLIGPERAAQLREVALLPLDLSTVVPAAAAGGDVVVLVHGFLASAGVFRPLRARLEREGLSVASFSHAPGAGVRHIARRLAALVERLPSDARVTVVGHSLGGVVARYYVQELGGHARVARTISLAAPFQGIDVPRVLVGADLHERSHLLARLRAGAGASGVPHTSIIGGKDTVVEPRAAAFGFGELVVLEDRGHNQLLFCERVAALVLDAVKTRS